jgi:parallel beta-helix repeat protein
MKEMILSFIIISSLLNPFVLYVNFKGNFEHLNSEYDGTYIDSYYLNGGNDLIFNFSFDEPSIDKIFLGKEVYDRVTLSDLPLTSQLNKPILPIKPVNILLPQKTIFKNIEVVASEQISLGEGYNIELGKKPIPINSDPEDIEREIITCGETSSNDNYSGIFPEKLYSNAQIQYFRGYTSLIVNLHPIFYEIKNGSLYYFKKVVLKVNLEKCNNINQLYRNIPKDKNTVATTVENPLMLETYSNTINEVNYVSSLVSTLSQYDYVIITSERLKSAIGAYTFQSLIDYKKYKGLSATIVTVEDIVSDPAYWSSDPLFNDIQAQIRNFIKDAYMNWNTEYILLGGDCDIIPYRELYIDYDDPFNHIDELIPSDLYYSCLDGNYNFNENIVWGEPTDGNNGGDIDLIGEVYVGRAPVNSWEDVSNFVRKTLTYEQTQDAYISNVLMCGEYMGADFPWGGDYKDVIADIIPNDYTISKLYDRDWPGHNWPKSELISRINDNVNFINHMGHANYKYAMKMNSSDLDLLTNNEFFFVYSQGCMAGGFDIDDCFGEELIKSSYGAFAAVMNTRYGWMTAYEVDDGPSQKFDKKFFEAIFDHGITQLGKANQKSKEELISLVHGDKILRYCYFELTLLGDPEISLKLPVSVQHDVAVKNIDSSTYMIPDTPTDISATVVNYGEADETNINVEFIIDGSVLDTEIISFLASQEEQIVNFPFTPILGIHDIRVEIQTMPRENIVYNNFKQQGFIAGPDISIDSVIPQEPPFYLYDSSEFEITINNLGVAGVQNIVVKLYVGSNVVDIINIPSLAGGNSYTTTMNWVPSSSRWYDLIFYVQPVGYESYTSISNNYYNTSIYPVNYNSKLYVDDDGNKDFKGIKQALYWACPDVTIYVNPGKYYGRILVDEKIDIVGSDKDSTIIYGYSCDYIIEILADQVTISGFTLREADRGIRIVDANGCVIEDNIFLDIYQTKEIWYWIDGAIVLKDSSFITIKNNYILYYSIYGNDDGLKIEGCSNIDVENNTIVNSGDGIYIDKSNNVHVNNNIIDGYRKFCSWGIRTKSNCHDNIFEKNTIYSNAVGMVIFGGENNLIKENMIICNREKRCTYFTEGTGIYVKDESYSVFKDNLISLNLRGIVVYSSNNLFYRNNLVKNDLNANDGGTNTWYNATTQEGNYWSDYTGLDNNGDGIGDTPYDVPGAGNNHDNCPAMVPFVSSNNAPSKPAKPSGSTNGKIGVEYTYSTSTTDPDGGFVQYGWDWNGDKNVDEWIGTYKSGETASASHTWENKGTYSIYVKASDLYGFESEWSDPLSVSMPRGKILPNQLFLQFLQNHPHMFPILRHLMGL